MTDDRTILEAISFEPMTGTEIGKGFAPDHIKDRASWGRKWLKRAQASGLVRAVADLWTADAAPTPAPAFQGFDFTVAPSHEGFLNTAQAFLQSWLIGTRDYKAPHANRGTAPRKHFPRAQRRIRFCNI